MTLTNKLCQIVRLSDPNAVIDKRGQRRDHLGLLETLALHKAIKTRLAAMMFLQYFVSGATWPIMSLYLTNHLHFSWAQAGVVLAILSGDTINPVRHSGCYPSREHGKYPCMIRQ